MELETERLRLRRMDLDDLDFMAAMLGDPEVTRYYPKAYSREEARGWIQRALERYERDGHALMLVEEKATGDPVGQVGLIRQEVEGERLEEIGYMLHRPYWGRGYATEAARAVRDDAFSRLELGWVGSLIRPVNEPSARVAQRIGMKPAREVTFHDLKHVLHRITRLEWEAIKSKKA